MMESGRAAQPQVAHGELKRAGMRRNNAHPVWPGQIATSLETDFIKYYIKKSVHT
jgi:hypothetical protein